MYARSDGRRHVPVTGGRRKQDPSHPGTESRGIHASDPRREKKRQYGVGCADWVESSEDYVYVALPSVRITQLAVPKYSSKEDPSSPPRDPRVELTATMVVCDVSIRLPSAAQRHRVRAIRHPRCLCGSPRREKKCREKVCVAGTSRAGRFTSHPIRCVSRTSQRVRSPQGSLRKEPNESLGRERTLTRVRDPIGVAHGTVQNTELRGQYPRQIRCETDPVRLCLHGEPRTVLPSRTRDCALV